MNISALFGPGNPCFEISTLFIRTRTSGSSGQSELKDFPGRPIQLDLDLTPDPPTVSDVDACGSWDDELIANDCDGEVKWYDAATNGELLHTGDTYSPGEITEDTSFWVSCTINGCEGPRTEVKITIIDNPELDPINDVTACDSYDLPVVGDISGTNLVSPK
ncbi:immunoglobulin domain-containing protein, partial [Salegentibacter sp. HM20]